MTPTRAQPPSDVADRLRDELDGAMQETTSTLADARIALRRHHLGDLAEWAVSLQRIAVALRAIEASAG